MIFPFYMKFRVIIIVAYNRIDFYIIWHICKILHDYLVKFEIIGLKLNYVAYSIKFNLSSSPALLIISYISK